MLTSLSGNQLECLAKIVLIVLVHSRQRQQHAGVCQLVHALLVCIQLAVTLISLAISRLSHYLLCIRIPLAAADIGLSGLSLSLL